MTLSYKKFLALILISITTLSVFTFSNTASAQEPETTLQPTQVVADIPEQYNEIFQIQWGGGSLYQLKQRLATMSCIVDTVFVYDNNQWNAYNQYQVPSTLTEQFRAEYSQLIPAGTLYASCFRICEFNYYNAQGRECESFEFLRQIGDLDRFRYPIDDTTFCTNDFDPLVVQHIFPLLSLHPETCIVRQENEQTKGYYSNFFVRYNRTNTYPNSIPFIIIYSPDNYISSNNSPEAQQKNKTWLLNTEIHELCHINQQWHVAQALQPDNLLTAHPNDLWYETLAGKEFIALAGFTNNNGEWTLLQNSIYNDIYSTNPKELGAEMCTFYIADRIGIETMYNYWSWERGTGYIWRNEPIEFNPSSYLTPEIREWLETYVVLPTITETE